MPYEGDNPFAEYLEALARLEAQVKIVAFHTAECARQAEKAADYTLLTVFHVNEALNER